ncbi:MAG: helix-turn-helix transcriptional regulator [Candidatus Pacebacteria bacterium]|nr:helix-turn-helix transcriptional regulator [Candidatus Paceibacterota bacterium]
MKEISEKLATNLKKIRTEKDLTQSELAIKLNVDKSFISNIENGKSNPTIATVANIAKALGISSEELIK